MLFVKRIVSCSGVIALALAVLSIGACVPPAESTSKVIDVYLLGGQSNALRLGAERLEAALENATEQDSDMHETSVFSYAVGATNLHTQWKADGTAKSAADGSIYKEFQASWDSYITNLRVVNPDAQLNIAAMFWHQGESDSAVNLATSSDQNRNRYITDLRRFIKDVRATLERPQLPFVIGRLSSQQTNEAYHWLESIQEAQDKVASADAYAVSVPMEQATVESDQAHFTTAGYETMAKLFAEAYRDNFLAKAETANQ